MRRLISISIAVLSGFVSYAQDIWWFSDEEFNLSVFVDSIKYDSDVQNYGRAVSKISINRGAKNVQTIKPEVFIHESFLDSNFIFQYEDVNFDGYKDIVLVNWISTSLYTTSWYWFFEPESKKFVEDTTLNELMNVEIDQDRKCIYTYWRIGFNEFGHAIYQWDNNQLILRIEETESWGIDPSKPGIHVIKNVINGKLTEVETEVENHVPLIKQNLYLLLWN